ncbi:MAG: histidine phosphatase family protein [Eubacterium sp.]|jgi:probable phosphoglycerate mutase|nr:histidine phosphatase family protein [Eubacterium sp.]
MLNLYITRHGETEWNVEGRMQGWKNSNLTEKGIKNAEELGKRLEDIEFRAIYSSSSQRALHTAELIRGNRDIEIIPDENLREINLGSWEGKQKHEFEDSDREGLDTFWNRPHLYKAKSGEDFFQVRARIEAVLKRIINENKDCNVMLVTHAVIVKTIMAIFKAIPVEKIWEQPFIHGTSLSIVEISAESQIRILMEGDMSHTGE